MKNKLIIILSNIIVLSVIFNITAVTFLDYQYCRDIRAGIEEYVSNSLHEISDRVLDNSLGRSDYVKLHSLAIGGIMIGYILYPEAAAILRHCLYGDGTDLEVSAEYIKTSAYLNAKIKKLNPGEHGPFKLIQKNDWRLSLAFNPYYLKITRDKVRIYCPYTQFIKLPRVYTVVPIGKFRFKIYDNIFTAIQSKPFYSYAEWNR